MLNKIQFNEIKIDDINIKRLFYWLFIASRGGSTRMEIVHKLLESPLNKNELSNALNLNYRTVEHHIKILSENNIIIGDDRKYDSIYYVKENMKNFVDEIIKEVYENEGGL